ncbi:hypothetical protein OG746_29330 [Streptomyces sp. NBC_01016]|uniref:hypothetical protein n=1 Tax=Streptomyces sp. NBC_01016 TaxID=2903720 RepID=UPI0022532AE0|nr:hypothetical protein [Streptomyces sp. NBC_01016]MCX4832841.1 hypothetical protein [Streptomyces sp. NBC_01016]
MSEHTPVHIQELAALQRQASLLWAQILGGQDTPRLRERVERLEVLQAALLWEMPAVVAECRSCGHAPSAVAA